MKLREIIEAIGEKDQYELSIRDKKNPSQTVTFQKGLTLNQANDKVYKLVKGIRQWGNDPSKLNFDNEKMDPSRIILIKNGKQIPHEFQPGDMGVTEDSGNPLLIHGLKAYKYTQGGKDYYISVQNGKETGQFDSLQDLKIHQTSLINGEIDSYVDNRNMGHPDGVSTMEGTLTEEQFDEAAGEKDACYHKVKSRYDVWPSAYASGALVKCRKVGAKNWGNSKKK